MEKLEKPAWLKISEKELKKIILELAKNNPPSKIGMILRDQYGIPTVKVYNQKLSKILEEHNITYYEELVNAEKKVQNLKEHLKKHITDRKAKHKLQKAQTRVNVLKRYLIKKGKIAPEKRKRKKK